MQVLGHGVDLVENARIERMLREHPQRFLERCFTAGEQEYADASPGRRVERLAVRFACKEAVLKAIGTGWRDGIAWTDIEVKHLPSGAPMIEVGGHCARIASEQGITLWLVSLSHTEHYAIASVIAGCGE